MNKYEVYEISCKRYGKIYVGQANRSLNPRFKEHTAHLKFRHFENSSVAQHMLEQYHQEDIKLVRQVNNWKLDCREAIEMRKIS